MTHYTDVLTICSQIRTATAWIDARGRELSGRCVNVERTKQGVTLVLEAGGRCAWRLSPAVANEVSLRCGHDETARIGFPTNPICLTLPFSKITSYGQMHNAPLE